MKRFVERAFERAGYVLTPKWRQERLALATLTQQLLHTHSVDCVVDVGANQGQYHQFLRIEAGYRGPVVSFEPQPELAQALFAASREDPAWQVHNLALGAEETELELHVMERSEFTSFLQPDNSATPQFDSVNRIKSTHRVPVKRLDAFESLHSCSRIFLKSDTQGFDMQVIRGASGLLGRIAVIQMELGVTRIYQGLPPYWEVLQDLHQMGFEPAGFVPVSTHADMAVIEFDCVMVNRSNLNIDY